MNYPEEFNKIPLIVKNVKKVYLDIEYDKTHPKFRQLPDKTTDAFTALIVKKYLINFIDYAYNAMNTKILLNINDLLEKNKYAKLSDEQIFVYFKGGNNFVLLDRIVNKMKEADEININNIPDSINNFIKISDNDFSISIIAQNENRFNEIYFCVKILLTNSLYEISNAFNYMYYNEVILNQYSKNNGDSYPNVPTNSSTLIDEYKQIDNELGYYQKYNNCMFFYTAFYPFNNNYEKQNEFQTEMKHYESCNNVFMLTILEYISSLYPNYVKNMNIINKIDKLMLNKQTFFYNKVYKNKINELFKILSEELNKTNLETIYYKPFSSKNEKFKLTRKVNPTDLRINDMPNTMIINTNTLEEPIGMTLLNHKPYEKNPNIVNCNYVTINSGIFNNFISSKHVVDFDLFRIKFNVNITVGDTPLVKRHLDTDNEWKNVALNIPSEFVDVSINKFDDINHTILTTEYYQDPINFINTHYYEFHSPHSTFIMMGYESIANDLINTLFKQSSYTPFYVGKYNKRIVRLFYFYSLAILMHDSNKILCNQLNNLKTELNSIIASLSNNINGNVVNKNNIQLVSDSFKRTFYNNDVTFDNIKYLNNGFLIYNLIDVKKEYELLQPLLNLILVYILILENEHEYVLTFNKKYNDLYNIILDENYDDIYINFYKFVNECLLNINICNNVFCVKNPQSDDPINTNLMSDSDGNKIIKVNKNNVIEYDFIDSNNEFFAININKKDETRKNEQITCKKMCHNSYTDEPYCCDSIDEKYNKLIDDIDKMPSTNSDKEKLSEMLRNLLKKRGY
jgi:hypothetical protein